MAGRVRLQGGITLIELLVAMVIMSVVSVGSYALFELVQQAQSRITLKETGLAELQRAMNWILEDTKNMVVRPIQDEFGASKPALEGRLDSIEFTRNSVIRVDLSLFDTADNNFSQEAASTFGEPWESGQSELSRVAYYIEDQTLVRNQWTNLDRAFDAKVDSSVLMQSVERIEFRFLGQGQWFTDWPQQNTGTQISSEKQLPTVIEVSLETKALGQVQRWIQVAADWPEPTEIDSGTAPPKPPSGQLQGGQPQGTSSPPGDSLPSGT